MRGGLVGPEVLRKGDEAKRGTAAKSLPLSAVRSLWLERFAPRRNLRVTAGPDADEFSIESLRLFYCTHYAVREESNRAGLRLQGAAIEPPFGGSMITEGVSLGAVQVPPGGQPIILFADQQTTGGYPIIANVISADSSSVAQLRPRDSISFELVAMERARELLFELEVSFETEAFESR